MAWEIVKAYFLIIAILLGGSVLVASLIIGFIGVIAGVIAYWRRILLLLAIFAIIALSNYLLEINK